jgi:hypothetical protein
MKLRNKTLIISQLFFLVVLYPLSLIYLFGWMDECVALVAANVRGVSPSCCPRVPLDFLYLNSGGALHRYMEGCVHSGIQRMPVLLTRQCQVTDRLKRIPLANPPLTCSFPFVGLFALWP